MGNIPLQTEPADQSIPLMMASDPVPFMPSVSPQIQAIRANKAAYGINMPENEVVDMFDQGREQEIRYQTSENFRSKNADVFKKAMTWYSEKTGKAPGTPEINQITDALIRQQQLYNPESIFEYSASKKAFDAFQWGTQQPGRWWTDYKSFAPQEANAFADLGEQYGRNLLIVGKEWEEAKAAYDASSWANWGLNQFMNFASFGIWNEAYQRGNVPEADFGLWPGTDRDNQRKTLMSGTPQEVTDTLKKAKAFFQESNNPTQYLAWLNQMMGAYSPSELNLDAFINALPLGFAISKGFSRGIARAKTIRDLNREYAIDATKNMTLATTGNVPMEIAVPAASGNIEEAAVQAVKATTVKRLQGKEGPLQDVTNDLPSGINVAREGLGLNPTWRELELRIKENFNIDSLIDRLRSSNKVERVPAALADEANIRRTKDIIIDNYRGPGNHVLDVTQRGPLVWDEVTNTHWFEMRYGKDNATYWEHPENAYEHAVAKGMHIHEWELMEEAMVLERELNAVHENLAARRMQRFPTDEMRAFIDIPPIVDTAAFDAETAALSAAYKEKTLKLIDLRSRPGVDIRNDGQGFYISRWVPLPETHPDIRAMLLKSPNAKTPDGWGPTVVRNLKMGGETFSADLNANAITATYGANNLHELFLAELNQIGKNARWTIPGLPKAQRWNDFSKWLDDLTHGNLTHPVTGERGYIPQSSQEFETYYHRSFERHPIEPEIKAFWSTIKYLAQDKAARQIRQFTDEARLGAELHRVELLDSKTGRNEWSPWFVGIDRSKEGFPKSSDGIGLMKKRSDLFGDVDEPTALSWNRHTAEDKKVFGEQIKTGQAKSIEVLHANEFPLKSIFGENLVEHVVGSKIQTKRLTLRDVPNIAMDKYDSPFAIKQADVRFNPASKEWIYYGEKTLFYGDSKPQLERYAKIMNEIRDHLHADRVEEASILARQLPFDFAQQHSQYLSGRLQTDPRLAFRVVAKGDTINKMDNTLKTSFEKEGFKDRSFGRIDQIRNDPHEIYKLRQVGSKHNPMWDYEPAKETSAITMLNRSMNRIVKSLYWDDFKTTAIEHWVQEAKQYLDLTGKSSEFLDHSPHHFFYHGELVKDMPLDVKAKLESNRFKIKQLLGVPSDFESQIHSWAQKAADWVGEKGGPRFTVNPLWAINKVNNWADASKSLAYHAFMGGFSPTQILAQSANYATIVGMAKNRAIAGAGIDAGMFHQFSRMNENWIKGMDKKLTDMGTWKPGQFEEARTLGMNTGFFKVGNEHTFKAYETGVIQSGKGMVADMGTVFWKAAERNQRFAAWYTAYLEGRAEKPLGAFNNQEVNMILSRAEQLTGSMSSASRTWVQKGLAGIPTQFMGYGLRMMDTMLGHRLDKYQKLTLFMTYATLFGVGGGNLFGVPFGDMMRTQMVGQGYKPGENAFWTLVNDGVLHGATMLATGKSYNIGQRFSVGIDAIRELYDEGLSMKIAGGAPWSALSGMIEGSNSLRTALGSMQRGDGKAPIKLADILDVAGPVKSLSDFRRYNHALETTAWINKQGLNLAENVSGLEALLMSVSGVQRTEATQQMDYKRLQDAREQNNKVVAKEFLKNMNRYFAAEKAGNRSEADDWQRKAIAVLEANGYPMDERPDLFSMAAAQQRGTVVQRAEEKYRLRGVPVKELEMQRRILMKAQEGK